MTSPEYFWADIDTSLSESPRCSNEHVFTLVVLASDYDALAAENAALRERLAEAERDAERYQWMRDAASGEQLMKIILLSGVKQWDDAVDSGLNRESAP